MSISGDATAASAISFALRWTAIAVSVAATLLLRSNATLGQQDPPGVHTPRSIIENDDFLRALTERFPVWTGVFLAGKSRGHVEPLSSEQLRDLDRLKGVVGRLLRADVLPSRRTGGLIFDAIPESPVETQRERLRFRAAFTVNDGTLTMDFLGDGALALRLELLEGDRIAGDPFVGANREQVLALLRRWVDAPFSGPDQVQLYGVAHHIAGVAVYSGVLQFLMGAPADRFSRPTEHHWFRYVHVLLVDGATQQLVFRFILPLGTDDDSDVANRPSFARAFSYARRGMPALFYFGEALPRKHFISEDAIAEAAKGALRERWSAVLTRASLPASGAALEWRQYVPVLTEHDHDVLMARWSVQQREVMAGGVGNHDGLSVVVRLHGDERLALGQRPDEFSRSAKDFGAFFDRAAFHELTTKVFRVPFQKVDDWLADGYDTTYEGVRVFHGEIVSREWAAAFRADRSLKPPHWWDQMQILVTDSDPQYFCVQITLREQDPPPDNR